MAEGHRALPQAPVPRGMRGRRGRSSGGAQTALAGARVLTSTIPTDCRPTVPGERDRRSLRLREPYCTSLL
eukprot:scaffold5586_cov124-Isochrysis_galbana.AAC.4